jgi:aromatic-L-amino-acid/L-tryptophan decarboxylase
LRDDIQRLAEISQALEPDLGEREALAAAVNTYISQYLENLAEMPAYRRSKKQRDFLRKACIGEDGESIDHILHLLSENVTTVGINIPSGRYLGHIPSGGLFHAALGDYLAAVTNRYSGIYFIGPGAVQIENILLRWMASTIGYPETASGNLTSGGSIANLIAIVTARESYDIRGETISRSVVYTTEHAHHSVHKALHIAGLRDCIQRLVPVDAVYRMNPAALNQLIEADKQAGLNPWLVIASAGTTNSGTVDPLAAIGEIANAHKLWFHIDGAYGGLFVLCPEGREILNGTDTSDSMTMDPHKSLFLPYGTGTVLVKDRQKHYAAFSAEADYIENTLADLVELSPSDLSPELTRHFRGLRLWLPLKLVGLRPFRAALSEKIYLARYFYEQIQGMDGFEVGPFPDLSIVTYRYLPRRGNPDEFNRRLMESIQKEGRVFISSTRIDGKFVLRAAILSFRTHLDEIDLTLQVLKEHAQRLSER